MHFTNGMTRDWANADLVARQQEIQQLNTALDEKSLLQTTLFGLPMLSVNLPQGRIVETADVAQLKSNTMKDPYSRELVEKSTTRISATVGLISAICTSPLTLSTSPERREVMPPAFISSSTNDSVPLLKTTTFTGSRR